MQRFITVQCQYRSLRLKIKIKVLQIKSVINTCTTSEQSSFCFDAFYCLRQKKRHPPASLLLLFPKKPFGFSGGPPAPLPLRFASTLFCGFEAKRNSRPQNRRKKHFRLPETADFSFFSLSDLKYERCDDIMQFKYNIATKKE